MSFVDKVRKPRSSGDVDFSVIEKENNFPFAKVDYLRLGSAHAVERQGDREILRRIVEPVATELRAQYEPNELNHDVIIVEK